MQAIYVDEDLRINVMAKVEEILEERSGYSQKADALEAFEGMLDAIGIYDQSLREQISMKWEELNSRYEAGNTFD